MGNNIFRAIAAINLAFRKAASSSRALRRFRTQADYAYAPLEERQLLAVVLQPNDAGTKFYHPTLSSLEVVTGANLAAAAYSNSPTELNAIDALNLSDFKLDGSWNDITKDLIGEQYGLEGSLIKNSHYFQADSLFLGLGDAEALLFENTESTQLALAFRGTESFADWINNLTGMKRHYDAFKPLIDAMHTYAFVNEISSVFVAGHSLGGAMVEYFMQEHSKELSNMNGIAYEGVAIASPQASLTNDDRVLNTGHESDEVYSIVGDRPDNGNATHEFYLATDALFETALGQQHDRNVYRYSVQTLLQSQFYDETTRGSTVIVSLASDPDDIEGIAEDFFSRDEPAVILGRDRSVTIGDQDLDEDDHLVGGRGADFLEGFAGNDKLRGDDAILFGFSGASDTYAGGAGNDTFMGTPREINGDTIVDLSVGDRIAIIGENVTQEDVELNTNSISINGDDGIFDIFGTTITINLRRADGTAYSLAANVGLKVLDEAPEEGGTLIEVVEEVQENGRDLAFVIDTTTSMEDDIDRVKQQSAVLVNEIFQSSGDQNNTRFAVVGYHDTVSPSVLLEFTEQETADERRTAAINAINGISLIDAGNEDLPEKTYTGILAALKNLGPWRPDAKLRQIVVFGDAEAKDKDLRDEVERLSQDSSVDIDLNLLAQTIQRTEVADGINMTSFVAQSTSDSAATPVPVQIFTVAIGTDPAVLADFAEIAEIGRGGAFTVDDETQLVDTLLEAINPPIFTVRATQGEILELDGGMMEIEFSVSRSDVEGPAAVSLSLAGTVNSSEIISAPEEVVFADSEEIKTVTVTVRGDTRPELNETVVLVLENTDIPSSFVASQATVTIIDNDPIPEGLLNSGFESPGNYEGLDQAATVEGWSTFPDADGVSAIDVVETQLLGNMLLVDSRAGNFDRIFQDVAVEAGEKYLIQFDIAGSRDGTDRSDQVNVIWDGVFVGAFRGVKHIQSVAVEVVAPADGFSRLEFREAFDEEGGDGQGSFIDNVSLVKVANKEFPNGGFEDVVYPSESTTIQVWNLEDWFTDGPAEERWVSVRNANTDGTSGGNYLNLDTPDRYDRVFHSVQTSSDREYVLTFDMRSPVTTINASNQLRVRWNGSFVTTRIPTHYWQTFSVTLPAAEDGASWLDLREAYEGEFSVGDGIGPWIDNVRIYEVLPDEAAENEAPTLDAISDRSAIVGQVLEIPASATNSKDEGLTFRLDRDVVEFPATTTIATIDGQPESSEIILTPSELDGTYVENVYAAAPGDASLDEKERSTTPGSTSPNPEQPQLVLAGDHDLLDDVFGSDF